jgi:hypothetical protein
MQEHTLLVLVRAESAGQPPLNERHRLSLEADNVR